MNASKISIMAVFGVLILIVLANPPKRDKNGKWITYTNPPATYFQIGNHK